MSVMPLLNVEAGTGAAEKYVLLWAEDADLLEMPRFSKIGLVG
jgi:hypothetical protein